MQRSFFVFLFSCFGVYETNRNVNQMVGASFFTSSIILSKSTSVKLHLFPKNGESFPQISSLLQRFQQGMMLQNISLSFRPLLPEPCVTSLMARGIKLLKLAPKSVVTLLPYLSYGGFPNEMHQTLWSDLCTQYSNSAKYFPLPKDRGITDGNETTRAVSVFLLCRTLKI